MHPFLEDIATFIYDTLFPMHCLSCGQEGVFICAACQPLLPRLEKQYCIICKQPSIFGLTHPKCASPHKPDGCLSLLDYTDPRVSQIVIYGKYKFLPSIYATLAVMLATFLERQKYIEHFKDYVLVPIPLAKQRYRWRGFNQAELLAKTLSAQLLLPHEPLLVRTKNTKTQKDLGKHEREKNINNAFALAKHADVHGKNIILVDDVVTTGSTLLEATKILKRNGAVKVVCLTIAKD